MVEERRHVLYGLDKRDNLRFSHENPSVKQCYEEYFEKPLSHRAHEILHVQGLDSLLCGWGVRGICFQYSSLSRSICRQLQSFLQCAKANALRLNELSHTELLHLAALTSTQLVIIQASASHSQPAESVWLILGVQLGVCGNCPSRGVYGRTWALHCRCWDQCMLCDFVHLGQCQIAHEISA